jgi:hypothetical protein
VLDRRPSKASVRFWTVAICALVWTRDESQVQTRVLATVAWERVVDDDAAIQGGDLCKNCTEQSSCLCIMCTFLWFHKAWVCLKIGYYHLYIHIIYIYTYNTYIYIHGIFFITFFFLEGNPTLREMPIKPDKPIFFSRLRGAGACTRTSSLVTGSRSSSPAVASGDLQLDPVGHSRWFHDDQQRISRSADSGRSH